jgi:hypothetical protein
MTSTLALLALYPEEQKRAYEAVRRAIDDQGELVSGSTFQSPE